MTPDAILVPDVLAVVPPAGAALQQRVGQDVGLASTIEVTDVATYQAAGAHLTGLAALVKEIEAFFDPLVSQAHKLHKDLTTKRRTVLEPVEQASARLRRAMSAWKTEQERLQRVREQEAAESLRREEEARLAAAAAELEAAGEPALAEAVLEQALTAPAPVVVLPATTPKVDGVSYQTVWKWRVLNVALVPREFLALDEAKVTAYAKAMKAGAKVPGLQFYGEQVPVVRGGRR